jgi:hypothetical protein
MELGKFEIELPKDWLPELEANRAFYQALLRRAVAEKIQRPDNAEAVDARLELVNIICRAKADVRNWKDLEREIFESSL